MHTMNEAGSNNAGGGGEGSACGPQSESCPSEPSEGEAEETRQPEDKAARHVTPVTTCFLERRHKTDEVVV